MTKHTDCEYRKVSYQGGVLKYICGRDEGPLPRYCEGQCPYTKTTEIEKLKNYKV